MQKDKARIEAKAALDVFDPDNAPFQVECLCTYLRELADPEEEGIMMKERENR
jgi:hypothetical protein